VAGICGRDDELSGSIKKAGYFFDKLNDNQLFQIIFCTMEYIP
jgi:hypothetical protein